MAEQGVLLCAEPSLPQPLTGDLLAVIPKSDCAYTSCHELLQGLIKHRFKSPGLRLHRDSSSYLVEVQEL